MRSKALAVPAACSALLIAGCGGDEGAGEGGGQLTISAAASLTAAFQAYGAVTEGEERFSFAGSDELAAQIRAGAPVDVFASANTSLPDALFEEGLVEEPVIFARNELVLAVPDASNIEAVGDLAAGGLDLVIGSEAVPVGAYTREVLGRLPGDQSDTILEQVRSEEPDVKGIVAKLVSGAGDAGFVYATDVAAADDELTAIELPPDLEPEVSYAAAVTDEASNPDGAQAFIDGLLDGGGREALLSAGFLPPGG